MLKPITFKTDAELSAVAYYRYSCDKQTENSIEGQRRDVTAYCDAHNITIVKEYVDEAKTGTETAHRTAYNQMLSDIRNNVVNVQYVMAWKLDRFGRQMHEITALNHELQKKGMKLYGVKDINMQGAMAPLGLALSSGMAEWYSYDLSEKVIRGNSIKAAKGMHLGSYIPLGYKVVAGKYEPDPQTAPIVRKIFQDYANGSSTAEIADYLNNVVNLQTPLKSTYTHKKVSNLLKNTKYIGTYTYNSSDINTGSVYIEHNHTPIIDESLFATCQAIMNRNKKAPATQKAEVKDRYLLSGRIFCGECGSTMQGMSATKKGVKYTYYACKDKRQQKSCSKSSIPRDALESFVIKACLDLVQDKPDLAKKIHELYVKQYGDTGITQFEKQYNDILIKIDNFITAAATPQALARPYVVERYYKMIDDLNVQADLLKTKLLHANTLRDKLPSVNDIQLWLSKITEISDEDLTPELKQKIINTFIHVVYVSNSSITIYFSIDNNPDPISFEDYIKSLEPEEDTSQDPDAVSSNEITKISDNFASGSTLGASPLSTQTKTGVINYAYYKVFVL